MTIIEQSTCTIQRLNHQGLGVGQTNKGQIELPFTLPGEKIKFTRHHYRGKSNCTLDEIITISPRRIAPTCQYFGRCGGCLLQHLDRKTYEAFKVGSLQNELNKAKINTVIKPLIVIDCDQRRRVNLQFVKKNEQIYLGYYRFHSHQIINIDSCPAALKEISILIVPLKKMLTEISITHLKGQIFITKAANGIEMMIEFADIVSINQDKLTDFAVNNNLIKLSIKDKEHEKIIFQNHIPYIEFANIKVEINYASFLQANLTADKVLTELIKQYLPQTNNLKILDLFCGRGTFSFPLADHGIVDGFEIDEVAIDCAVQAAHDNKITLVNFSIRNLFEQPLDSMEINKYDFVLINPPRRGALKQCLYLAQSNVSHIVYVSCNIQSFVKDAFVLINDGYILKEATPVDQFYWTPHSEIVGFFTKIY